MQLLSQKTAAARCLTEGGREIRQHDSRPMESLGDILRSAREKKGVSLRDVADETKISSRYLEAIEAGRFAELPGGMYNRAFLRTYAEALGLDIPSVLAKYDDAVATPTDKPVKARSSPRVPRRELRLPPLLAWSLLLLVSVGGLYFSRGWISQVFRPYFSRTPAMPAPAAGSQASEVNPPARPSAPAAADAAAPSPGQEVPQPTLAPEEPPKPLRVEFEVIDKCWASVNSDGNRVLVNLLEPGDTQAFDAEERVYIVLGNAGGVRLRINGKPAKPLGKPGEVVKVLITLQNVADFLESPGA